MSGIFTALKNWTDRLFWSGNLISLTGSGLDRVVQNWLLLSTSGNPMMLSVVNLGRSTAIMIFALFGGVLADHLDRRKYLIDTQSCTMIVALPRIKPQPTTLSARRRDGSLCGRPRRHDLDGPRHDAVRASALAVCPAPARFADLDPA
ncbi:MFS transporter [Pseudooceanicola sp.]|uniref:MFS transporter n=1 Tax=Pseudooceanicola sp. TaxID=1914328 RepID=UPI00260E434C|nr:MFS transporter [Pseudooceanicola sp.]MDF1857193.1 MFS transporter [Pseudooceanicola sp.]